MSKARKRKCHFSDEYPKTWSFMKKGRTNEALCSICNCFISFSRRRWKADVKHHISMTNNKNRFAVVAIARSISEQMIKENTQEEVLIAAAELTTAYKVVKHHLSFISLDCTMKLNSIMNSDSKIAANHQRLRPRLQLLLPIFYRTTVSFE